jgi:poly(ADP-ribose) glycohydrolase ARH3
MPFQPLSADRVRGALVGAVIGDAFGSPLEGAPASTVAALVNRRAQGSGPWGYTDDATMFIALAESIRDCATVSPVGLLEALSRAYEPARGFGRGMKLALRAFESGTPWRDVAKAAWPEGSQGNGGAVRVGAVALRRWSSVDHLLAAAFTATRVTHSHPEALGAALAQARLLALVLDEPEFLASATATVDRISDDLPGASAPPAMLALVREAVQAATDLDVARICGTSPLARESVPAAHAIFLRSHRTFEEAVTAAARLGGDVDSICALVGCLAGALHGVEGIPARWIAAIAHESPSVADLCALADALVALPPAPFEEEPA